MMGYLLPTFTLVNPLPPYPEPWESLSDEWDIPIWAAAKLGQADLVVSENTTDFPPANDEGRHIHEGIEYMQGETFLDFLNDGLE